MPTTVFQMNCCGSVGPEDYRNSAWFNRTRPIEDVFVPSSCCIIRQSSTVAATSDVTGTKRRPEVKMKSAPRQPVPGDENQCQLDAVLYPHNEQPALSLKTQVIYACINHQFAISFVLRSRIFQVLVFLKSWYPISFTFLFLLNLCSLIVYLGTDISGIDQASLFLLILISVSFTLISFIPICIVFPCLFT